MKSRMTEDYKGQDTDQNKEPDTCLKAISHIQKNKIENKKARLKMKFQIKHRRKK